MTMRLITVADWKATFKLCQKFEKQKAIAKAGGRIRYWLSQRRKK